VLCVDDGVAGVTASDGGSEPSSLPPFWICSKAVVAEARSLNSVETLTRLVLLLLLLFTNASTGGGEGAALTPVLDGAKKRDWSVLPKAPQYFFPLPAVYESVMLVAGSVPHANKCTRRNNHATECVLRAMMKDRQNYEPDTDGS
jgi:hypothetical protein